MRCNNCGGVCNCQVTSPDGSVTVTPTTAGYQLAVPVAADQAAGAGGANALTQISGALFLGTEQLGAGGAGGGGVQVITQKADGTADTSLVSAVRVVADGYGGQLDQTTEPRMRTLADGSKALIIPGVNGLTGGQAQVTVFNMATPANWLGTLPRSTSSPQSISVAAVGGQVVAVPATQTRRVAVHLTVEVGQISPDPATFTTKTAAWIGEWRVNLMFGSTQVIFTNPLLRWEPQPYSRQLRRHSFIGAATIPAGNWQPTLKIDLVNDSLPSSPNIQVGLAGWATLATI